MWFLLILFVDVAIAVGLYAFLDCVIYIPLLVLKQADYSLELSAV